MLPLFLDKACKLDEDRKITSEKFLAHFKRATLAQVLASDKVSKVLIATGSSSSDPWLTKCRTQ